MKINIVAAGKIKEKYLTAGINEFLKRLTPFAQVKIIEISEEKMKDNWISIFHVENLLDECMKQKNKKLFSNAYQRQKSCRH